jgi:2'-5' RNA ligase
MSSSLVRAFFALPLEEPALEAIASARAQIRRRSERGRLTARFLPDEALHVTLCFVGYVERDTLPDFLAVLRKAARLPLIESEVRALGAFPNPRRARVESRAGRSNATRVRQPSFADSAARAIVRSQATAFR